MMNVQQIISNANTALVVEAYKKYYCSSSWAKPETFEHFRTVLNNTVSIVEDMEVRITRNDDDDYFDVSGFKNDTSYALDLTSWGEWKLMDVVNHTGDELTNDELAAHLYYEMTWHGWPEDILERKQQLLDTIESLGFDGERND